MPLNRDPKGGGTEADGSISAKYCSYCYEKGKFTWPEATAKEMQKFCRKMMREEEGFSAFTAWLLTLGIPNLERWKKPLHS